MFGPERGLGHVVELARSQVETVEVLESSAGLGVVLHTVPQSILLTTRERGDYVSEDLAGRKIRWEVAVNEVGCVVLEVDNGGQ